MKKLFALATLITAAVFADQSATSMADVSPRSMVAPEESGFDEEDLIILEDDDEDTSFIEDDIAQN